MDDISRSGGDIQSIITQLMGDEKFGEIVSAVKSTMAEKQAGDNISDVIDNVSAASASMDDTEKSNTDTAASSATMMPQISPELISKLPEIMSMLSLGGSSGKDHDKKGDSKINDRKRLLQALKPFLSNRRREAVDSIVNIAGIADLFGI